MGRGASASNVTDKENVTRSKQHNMAPSASRPAVTSRPLYKPVAPRFMNAHANPRAAVAAAAAAAAASTSTSTSTSVMSTTTISTAAGPSSAGQLSSRSNLARHQVARGASLSSSLPLSSSSSPSDGSAVLPSQCSNSSSTLTTSIPASDRDGAEWERAMDARLAQWRYMNLVAVAELQAEEREACAEIDRLANQLEEAMDEVAKLTAKLDAVRAVDIGATFSERARPCLELLAKSLAAMRPEHARVCAALVESLEALPTRNIIADPGAASALAREIARFRVAAVDFAAAADGKGAGENCAVALEDLARCVAEEAPGVRKVLCTAIRDAAHVLEQDMSVRAAGISCKRRSRRSLSSSTATSSLSSNILISGLGSAQRFRRRTSVGSG